MGDQTSIIIPTFTEEERFKKHLESDNNQRIIFSSPFGSGKTYFLERFFDEKKEVYEPFFLSPVHYSVSRNEDVFEYIKYDILINLLMKENVNWNVTQIEDQLIAQFFVINNFGAIAKELINFLGKTGRLTGTIEGDIVGTISSVTNTVISNLSKLKSKYDKYKQEINTNDKYTSIKFLEELSQQTGSIFEYNDITALINNALNSIDADKKKVLIIDDLDRMDPEHIFRILNVFSAQFDHERFGYNKFAFNKVIIVCDLNNIRNLFAHKYGSNVDFSGYIDKFYSVEPFVFDNKKALSYEVTTFINSNSRLKKVEHESQLQHITPLIEILVENDIISLRKLIEHHDKLWENPFNDNNAKRTIYYNRIACVFADYILFLYGYIKEDLCRKLQEKNIFINISEEVRYKNILNTIIHLLNKYDNAKKFIEQKKTEIEYTNINLNIKIHGEIISVAKIDSIKNLTITTCNDLPKNEIPFFQLLSECIENYTQLNRPF